MARKPIFRTKSFQELWRSSPEFVGPMMPPMLRWFAHGRLKSAWEIEAEARYSAGLRRWEREAMN